MSNPVYMNAAGKVLSLSSSATATSRIIWAAAPGVTTAALGGGHILYGDSSDDTFVIFTNTDQVVIPTAPHGVYTVADSAWLSTYTLQAGVQDLIVSGTGDVVSGNSLNNLIITQSGAATVSGGGGDDVFVLGTGADTIIDPQGSGSDVIYGFKNGTDHVRLDGSTVFANWTKVQSALTQVGSNVVLNMGIGQTLTFVGEQVSNFTASDFYLPVDKAAMTMTFDDEFSTFSSSPNGSVGWMTSWPYGGINARAMPGNGDATYYSDFSVGVNPFSVSNGILDLTATASSPGGNPDGMPYTSGVMTTYNSFAQTYGYFEINAELPSGAGLWPSFYMQSMDNTAELDIFEVLGINPSTLYATATQHVIGGASYSTTNAVIIPDASAAFHTYGVDWEPDTITFYMDGNVIATAPTPASMHQPMYMIVGMGVGTPGSWAGAPDANTVFPATMQIDYIRAYATAATISVSGSDAILPGSISGQALVGGVADPGVSVTLLTAAGAVVAVTQTDSTGDYSFAGVAAGTYQVRYIAPSGQILQSGGAPNTTSWMSGAIMLASGQGVTLSAQALVNLGQIASKVLFYANTTATAATGDAGVTVSLLNAAGVVIAKTTSGATGAFSFSGVAPGTYQLQYTAPNGQAIRAGGAANQTTGLTASFTVAAGKTASAPTGAFVPAQATVSGQVLLAGDADAQVSVALLNAVGQPVATTKTDPAGNFTFGAVAPGSYQVKYTAPSGQVLETGSAANSATGLSPVVTVVAGQTATLAAETLITNSATIQSNVLHFGGATDPVWGGGDAGVTVSLLNAAGTVVATKVSDAGGWFSFAKLAAGTYQLLYAAPTGQSVKGGGTGLTAPMTVVAGQNLVATQGAMVTTDPGVTLGSGPDSLVVNLSEDNWLGNAHFTIAVDGKQIGGVQTATATHGIGQTQSYTLDGTFASGTNTVTVNFLNDAYGGTPTTDRNLYVDSIKTGGTTTTFNTSVLGTKSFAVDLPAAATTAQINVANLAFPSIEFTSASGVTATTLGASAATVNLTGNNLVTAGSGADLFNVTSGSGGTDILSNFNPAVDKVHLSGYNLADPASHVVVGGANSTLSLSGDTTLVFANTHGLTASNFT